MRLRGLDTLFGLKKGHWNPPLAKNTDGIAWNSALKPCYTKEVFKKFLFFRTLLIKSIHIFIYAIKFLSRDRYWIASERWAG